MYFKSAPPSICVVVFSYSLFQGDVRIMVWDEHWLNIRLHEKEENLLDEPWCGDDRCNQCVG